MLSSNIYVGVRVGGDHSIHRALENGFSVACTEKYFYIGFLDVKRATFGENFPPTGVFENI